MARRKRRTQKSAGAEFVKRGARSLVSILVLTALVLGIAFSVKQISSFDAKKLASLASPYLAKVGIGEEQAGQVAGKFIDTVTDLGIEGVTTLREELDLDEKEEEEDKKEESKDEEEKEEEVSEEGKLFSVAILSDSHVAQSPTTYVANINFLKTALEKIGGLEIETVFHLGDLTNLGVTQDLKTAKTALDNSSLDYYTIPGDRDLWQSVGQDNFIQVFGDNFHFISIDDISFAVLDNSANYTEISEEDMATYEEYINKADFVLLSQPLFADGLTPLYVDRYMGSSFDEITDETLLEKQAAVKAQRDQLLELVRLSNTKAIIAGDHHKSSKLKDPEDPTLTHYAVGATTNIVNEFSQSTLESQSFTVLNVFEGGKFTLQNVSLE